MNRQRHKTDQGDRTGTGRAKTAGTDPRRTTHQKASKASVAPLPMTRGSATGRERGTRTTIPKRRARLLQSPDTPTRPPTSEQPLLQPDRRPRRIRGYFNRLLGGGSRAEGVAAEADNTTQDRTRYKSENNLLAVTGPRAAEGRGNTQTIRVQSKSTGANLQLRCSMMERLLGYEPVDGYGFFLAG